MQLSVKLSFVNVKKYLMNKTNSGKKYLSNIMARPAGILLVCIVLSVVFLFGHISAIVIYSGSGDASPMSAFRGTNSQGQILSEADLGVYWEVYDKLQAYYIDKELPNSDKFAQASVKGLISALDDPYTVYYTPEEWEEVKKSNAGEFDGIGVRLRQGESYAVIETPITGSPAQKAGIMPRDLITEVDGESMEDLSVTQIASKIRGEKGTSVDIKIFRQSENKFFEFSVKRGQINTPSVEYSKLSDGGVHIKLSRFTESDFTQFQMLWSQTVKSVQAENPKYIILDLRNNTGGWVEAAVFVLDEFIEKDRVVFREQDRDGNITERRASRNGAFENQKIVVLVNGGSASASEIVAGALQDYKIAKLVGNATVGKGVEQTVQPTSDGGSVQIVFKRWLTPNGTNLSKAESLKPDYEVDYTASDVSEGKDPQLDKAIELMTK